MADYKFALEMTSEILVLELIHRIGTCVFEVSKLVTFCVTLYGMNCFLENDDQIVNHVKQHFCFWQHISNNDLSVYRPFVYTVVQVGQAEQLQARN